jgi:hypothetical protein
MHWLARLTFPRALGFALLWPVILVVAPVLVMAAMWLYFEISSRLAGAGPSMFGVALPVPRNTLLLALPPALFLCAWWLARHGYLDRAT